MKTILYSLFITLIITSMQINSQAQTNDTAVMGASYANDIFYSLKNGTVKSEPRNNWDLGFYTNRWSAGIIINDGLGVKLYTYPKSDISGWNSIDTSGISQWVNTYNSDTVWEDGAFNRHALGHPDYGWGVYNMVSHDVVGDSLYILQLSTGGLKKVWIERKNSVLNTYYFKYADIDGQNEVIEVLDVTPFESKLFVYYSIANQAVIDREPAKADWDLLFSKYAGTTFDSEGNPAPYIVTGVISNITDTISANHQVSPDFEDWTAAAPFNGDKATIGHSWKTFNMGTYTYDIEDSLVYFVRNESGDIYKFVLDYFSGSSTGKFGFVKKQVGFTSINETNNKMALTITPNPASSYTTVQCIDATANAGMVKIYDQSGRMVVNYNVHISNGQFRLDVSSLQSGLYILELNQAGKAARQKLMVQQF